MKSESPGVRTMTEPLSLPAGSRIALIAPSGPLRSAVDVERAVATAASLGWQATVGASALKSTGYFAGSDDDRAADLNWAIADPDIDGIWCLRGGYGAMRLLGKLDVSPLRLRPKPLMGLSDITALHAAWQRVGVISYHAPVAHRELSAFSRESLQRAVMLQGDSAGTTSDAVALREGRVTGRLAGGNLALVAALCGTPWAVDFRDAIVVLEDINEPIYRVDRLLMQLRLAGALDGCRGLMFGQCTNCPETSDLGSRTLREVIQETGDALAVPTLMGVPIGHIDDQWTLPLGAAAVLDTRTRTLQIQRHLRD